MLVAWLLGYSGYSHYFRVDSELRYVLCFTCLYRVLLGSSVPSILQNPTVDLKKKVT